MKRRLLINIEESQFDWIRSQAINRYLSYSEVVRQLINDRINIKSGTVDKISSDKDIESKRAEMIEDKKIEFSSFNPVPKLGRKK